jgi:hypothetical protein
MAYIFTLSGMAAVGGNLNDKGIYAKVINVLTIYIENSGGTITPSEVTI